MREVRFTVYSDIHHHKWTTGVTLEDTLAVERAVTKSAEEHRSEFVLFCGDRFESRNPHDEVRVQADRVLKERDRDLLVPCFYLVGNHDQYYKRFGSGHTMATLQLFGDVLPRSVIMDRAETYEYADLLGGVAIHALPAESSFDLGNYDVDPGVFNILVLHDLLNGTLADLSGFRVSGVPPSVIDHECFDVVFGGDAHIPQRMPLKNTRGGYIGSALQFTRRDRGDDRGWINVVLSEFGFESEFVLSSGPRFLDVNLTVPIELDEAIKTIVDVLDKDWGDIAEGNIVTLIVRGAKDDTDKIDSKWSGDIKDRLQARRVNLVKNPDVSVVWEIEGMESEDNSPQRDLQLYIESGLVDLEGLDVRQLMNMASEVFDDV